MYGGGKGGCLTGARFTMSATLLHQNEEYTPPGGVDPEDYGQWVNSQDPLTGEIIRVWEPYDEEDLPDPTNPDHVLNVKTIPCIARGIVDGGIRVAGTTEWFGADYKNIDFIKLWVPPNVFVSKRDRITNVADRTGKVLWRDEEFATPGVDTPVPTIFNVNGVTPLLDAFNNPVEYFVLLERAEV